MRVEANDGRFRSTARGRVLAAAAGTAMVLAAVLALPGSAAAAPTGPDRHLTHPEQDHAGSTSAAHEGGATGPVTVDPSASQTPGMDVSATQGTVDWDTAWRNGARFVYIKATESTTYVNPDFAAQFLGSGQAGLLHGAYHFAAPDASSGQTQADFFVANGGNWSKDGQTLPPALDIEDNPFGDVCYAKSQAAMVTWIKNFVDEVHLKTTRWPVIYTTTAWWDSCTGDNSSFGANDPLFIGSYSTEVGTLPAGWNTYTFWQYAGSGVFPGGQDRFNGTLDQLKTLANG